MRKLIGITAGSAVAGLALIAGVQAAPAPGAEQLAALPAGQTAVTGITLPPVTAYAPAPIARTYNPYTAGTSPRASSANKVNAPHFKVWAGYDADAAMHPFSNELGPCPQGAFGSGCGGHKAISSSHYERAPFTD